MKRSFSWRATDTPQHWIVFTVACSCGWHGAARSPRAIREAEQAHRAYEIHERGRVLSGLVDKN